MDLASALDGWMRIARFLRDVVGLEDEGAWPEEWISDLPLPTMVVERLREVHAYQRPLYLTQLERFAEHLDKGIDALTDKDMDLLDDIVLATTADANAVFRRLMRWA